MKEEVILKKNKAGAMFALRPGACLIGIGPDGSEYLIAGNFRHPREGELLEKGKSEKR